MHTPGTIELELIGPVNFYLGMFIQIITALFLGSLVGIERERRMKSAGVKTNVLICLGACIYTTISLVNIPEGSIADPNRTAAQIVSGIGFLGAGAIIQSRGNVVGLTTAAGIWVVAAIGITIGSGYPILATMFTLSMLIVLRLMKPISKLAFPVRQHKSYHVQVVSSGKVKKQIKQILAEEVDELEEIQEHCINKQRNERALDFVLNTHPKQMQSMSKRIRAIMKVDSIHYHAIGPHLDKAS